MIPFENSWTNLILSIPYNFILTLRKFYCARYLAILVINTFTTLENEWMESQSSAILLINYFINYPFASRLGYPKIHLAMVPLVFPHNHSKVSRLIFSSMGWPLIIVTKRLSMKESMVKSSGCWSQIISLVWSIYMQELPKHLLLPW